MTQSGNQFDHDDLRDALRRALPAQPAPQALRDRIAAMLRDEEVWTHDDMPEPVTLTQPAGLIAPPTDPYTRIAWLGNLFRGSRRVAMAACIAGLGLGAALFLATNSSSPPDSAQIAQSIPAQPFLQAALVHHDEMLQAPDSIQMPGGPLGSLQQVRAEVQNRTAAPMPEADISSQGWQLVGGKTCRAADACIAQIFYRRGQQTLSVFMIPPDAQGRRMNVGSSINQRNHLITTREAGQFTVCVVGYSPDGKLTANEVDRVADLIASH